MGKELFSQHPQGHMTPNNNQAERREAERLISLIATDTAAVLAQLEIACDRQSDRTYTPVYLDKLREAHYRATEAVRFVYQPQMRVSR